MNIHSNTYRRFSALQSLGNIVQGVDIDPFIYKGAFIKFHHHLNFGPGILSLNKEIFRLVKKKLPDIIWVDNRTFITASTLKKIHKISPTIKIINLITDDATGNLKYQWRLCLKTAKYYDFHFVQRSVNIQELKKYGALQVELCYRSYDPQFHRPVILNRNDKLLYTTNVGFIGTYEKDREEYIAYLITNGIEVNVTGDGWPGGKHWSIIRPYYKGPSIYGEPYIKTINGMSIALHFLRHENRDEQDSRTFEIPACGVFMLAEKTALHLSLFEEGKEAVFFDSKEEMLEKVLYYLGHEAARKNIANAGFTRCKASGYSHAERLKEVLNKITSH